MVQFVCSFRNSNKQLIDLTPVKHIFHWQPLTPSVS